MFLKALAIFIFLILPEFVWSQDISVPHNSDMNSKETLQSASKSKVGFGLHVMPLSLMNNRSRIRIGSMIAWSKISTVLDIEYGGKWVPSIFFQENTINQFVGFRPEIRYHFKRKELVECGKGTTYVGVEGALNVSNRNIYSATYASSGNRYEVESANQKRTRLSWILKIGMVVNLGKHWYVDSYAGFGTAYRHIDYRDEVNKIITLEEPTQEWFSSSDNLPEGKVNVGAVALGFRVGYWLR